MPDGCGYFGNKTMTSNNHSYFLTYSCMLSEKYPLHSTSFCCHVFLQNDLMCYEKIESGILVLHKEVLTPLPFVQECFNGFRAEAQERGVILHFNPPSLLGDLLLSHCVHSISYTSINEATIHHFQDHHQKKEGTTRIN